MRFVSKNENGQNNDSINFTSCYLKNGKRYGKVYTQNAKFVYYVTNTMTNSYPLFYLKDQNKRRFDFSRIAINSNRSEKMTILMIFTNLIIRMKTIIPISYLNSKPVRVDTLKRAISFKFFKMLDYFQIESYEMKFVLITKKTSNNN